MAIQKGVTELWPPRAEHPLRSDLLTVRNVIPGSEEGGKCCRCFLAWRLLLGFLSLIPTLAVCVLREAGGGGWQAEKGRQASCENAAAASGDLRVCVCASGWQGALGVITSEFI